MDNNDLNLVLCFNFVENKVKVRKNIFKIRNTF